MDIIHIACTDSYSNRRTALYPTVLRGMDVVARVDSLGSQSGKPSGVIRITNSGELPRPLLRRPGGGSGAAGTDLGGQQQGQ